jgi:hypothetical protein
MQTDVSWEGEVSPWPIITFWDPLHSSFSGVVEEFEGVGSENKKETNCYSSRSDEETYIV